VEGRNTGYDISVNLEMPNHKDATLGDIRFHSTQEGAGSRRGRRFDLLLCAMQDLWHFPGED
jgi:hypothetical protein